MGIGDQLDFSTGFPEPSDPGAPPPERLDPELPGPYSVGTYARKLQQYLRQRANVLLIGEVVNLRRARASTYFELRDADGALPCAIWNDQLERLELDGQLADGVEVVAGGGLDYYPGSATSSPSFSFRVTHLRLAGEGDLLARLQVLRKRLEADGLFLPQKELPRPLIPKTIGVVTARGSAACRDLLAGLERRGWRGTIVWADAPVQDRRAAPQIASALRSLAEQPQVEVAVVCRGGGSLADLWAFCDENLCRTVALLRLPVVSAIGHESDQTLIDDVSAVSCSTPTHAAEELVGVDVRQARRELHARALAAQRCSRAAVRTRGRRLVELAGAPARSVRAERLRLHQLLREIRASATRGIAGREQRAARHALVLARKGGAASTTATDALLALERMGAGIAARARDAQRARLARLAGFGVAVRGHDPQRTLERGYALVEGADGDPVTSAQAAREEKRVRVRFADDAVAARIEEDEEQ
jgi:exodeoxyribonuclease VII large subunit